MPKVRPPRMFNVMLQVYPENNSKPYMIIETVITSEGMRTRIRGGRYASKLEALSHADWLEGEFNA